jgi:O-antigen/teichoic acid export membrane protein
VSTDAGADPPERPHATPRRIARNALIRSGGEVVAKAASVAFYVVMARELGSEGFGDFMFALSLTSVLLLGSGFGIDDLTFMEVGRDKRRAGDYLGDAVAIKLLTSFALLTAAAIAVNIADYSSEARLAVYLVGTGNAIETLSWSWHAIFGGHERLELTAVAVIAQRIVTAVAGVAVLLSGGGLIAASAIFLGGAFLGLLVSHVQLRRLVPWLQVRTHHRRWLPLIKAGFPIGVATLLFMILIKLDTVMLSFLEGGDNSQVGFYSAAYRLVEATMFVSWIFSHSSLPWLARQEEEGVGLARGGELGLKALTAVLMPIGVTFAVLAPQLIELFYGSAFEDAVTPLRWLGLMTVLYGINFFASTILVARGRPSGFTRAAVIIIVQNVVFNLVLIPIYGASGAAFNAVLSGVLLAVLAVRQVGLITRPVNPMRAFAGSLIAGAAMAGVVLAAGLPLIPSLILGPLVYAAALTLFERLFHPDDFRLALSIARGGSRLAQPAHEGSA